MGGENLPREAQPPFLEIFPIGYFGLPGIRPRGAAGYPRTEAPPCLASLSGDPDWEFPLTLKEGVPLGVSDPTLTSPGVWPTKEELLGEAWLGEDPPPPVAHDNYPTAELFAKEIESTFYEERALDMVDGPFTRSEAAERCRCKPEELCPGPLAGIDESDKIRTIYDGSKGGANAHIQAWRRRPPHRWLETASMPSTGLGQRRTILIYSELGMFTSRRRGGTPTAPACSRVPRALIGAGG